MNKWDRFFVDIVKSVANLSTCGKYKVGAIIVKEKRIISMGYNGTPSKWTHCKDDDFYHSKYEIHAEMNAIGFACRNGMNISGATLYVTMAPCFSCAKLIVASGISEVVYIDDYKDWQFNDDSIDFLLKSDVVVRKAT